MNRIDPVHFLHPFGSIDVEVDHHRFIVAAHQHAFERRIARAVNLLVRHIGRYEYEIACIGLGDELEPVAPAHPRHAAHHVDDALQRAVVVCAGFGVRMYDHGPGPNLLRTAGRIHGGGAQHARCLRRIAVQPVTFDDLDTVDAPVAQLSIRHEDFL